MFHDPATNPYRLWLDALPLVSTTTINRGVATGRLQHYGKDEGLVIVITPLGGTFKYQHLKQQLFEPSFRLPSS